MKFSKGKSGNPGGRAKVLGELQELARHHAPEVVAELARLALKARSKAARIAAGRELLDRGFGKCRQSMEVSLPDVDILQKLLDDVDSRMRDNGRKNLKVLASEPQAPKTPFDRLTEQLGQTVGLLQLRADGPCRFCPSRAGDIDLGETISDEQGHAVRSPIAPAAASRDEAHN